MSPIITVSGVPHACSKDDADTLKQEITQSVAGITELNLTEKQCHVHLCCDHKSWGDSDFISVEIKGLFIKPERTKEVKDRLCEEVSQIIILFLTLLVVDEEMGGRSAPGDNIKSILVLTTSLSDDDGYHEVHKVENKFVHHV